MGITTSQQYNHEESFVITFFVIPQTETVPSHSQWHCSRWMQDWPTWQYVMLTSSNWQRNSAGSHHLERCTALPAYTHQDLHSCKEFLWDCFSYSSISTNQNVTSTSEVSSPFPSLTKGESWPTSTQCKKPLVGNAHIANSKQHSVNFL